MCNEQLEHLLSEGDLRAAVSDLVPKYQQSIVIGLLDDPSPSTGSIESAGMQLLGENHGIGIVFQTGAGGAAEPKAPIWNYIQRQCYELFCTNSSAYKAEQKEGAATIKHLVTWIATAVAGHYSLPIGVVTGPVILAVTVVLKVTRNAYCDAYKPNAKGS
ncbi:MAG: hypothetical protein QJR04_29125, partial [Burkholderia multivorans]|nr:hypothetical protein [Burkholderia multivorans]